MPRLSYGEARDCNGSSQPATADAARPFGNSFGSVETGAKPLFAGLPRSQGTPLLVRWTVEWGRRNLSGLRFDCSFFGRRRRVAVEVEASLEGQQRVANCQQRWVTPD